MVDLSAASCVTKPDLGRAIVMPLDKDRKAQATTTIGVGAPCFEQQGAKGLYALFKLPTDSAPSIVSVGSVPLGEGVFAPHLVVLDGQGAPLREIERDKFLFHAQDSGVFLRTHLQELSVLFRTHPEDRYVLVVSDPEVVGQSFTQITETTHTYAASTGTSAFIVYTGNDTSNGYTYAHNGTISVTVAPVPDVKLIR